MCCQDRSEPLGVGSEAAELGCYAIIVYGLVCCYMLLCVLGGLVMSRSKMKATWSVEAGCEKERATYVSP